MKPEKEEALPPLPEKRWAGFCGKCNSVTKFQERPNTKAAPCGRCGYATFCEELDYSDDEMRTYARAALSQRQQVPEGWQLVPVEPTPEMLRVLWSRAGVVFASDCRAAWAAMLAAAPALTAAPSAQAEPCRSDGRCQYAIDHGAEGLGHCPQGKCVMPAAQPRYTFWTGDGEAAMQPDPNGNWLWIGDPAKAPKGL